MATKVALIRGITGRWGRLSLLLLLTTIGAMIFNGVRLWRLSRVERTMRIGFQDSAPYHFPDASGNPTGPVVDIVREAARRENINLQWIFSPKGPEAALTSGEVDLWPIMGDLPERRAFMFISAPWTKMSYVLVADESLRLHSAEDLGRASLAVAHINLDSRLAREHFSSAAIVNVPNVEQVTEAVCTGRAQAGLVSKSSFTNLRSNCRERSLQAIEIPNATFWFGIGASKQRRDARHAARMLREQIGKMARDGSFVQIDFRWQTNLSDATSIIFEYDDTRSRLFVLFVALAVVLPLLIGMFWLTHRLRRARRQAEAASRESLAAKQVAEKAADEVRESAAMFKALVDNANEGIVIADSQGKIISINPTAEEIFRWSAVDVIGKPITILMPASPAATGEPTVTDSLIRTSESVGLRKSGEGFPLDLSLASWKTGEKTFFASMIRDLTERKRLENELTQAHKLESIGQLAAGIAHEINTPIQYVGDNTRFLQEAFGDLLQLAVACDRYVTEHGGTEGSSEAFAGISAVRHQVDLEFLKNEAPKAIEESLEGIARVAAIVRAMKEFSHPGPQELTPTDINHAIRNCTLVSKSEWKYIADLVEDFDSSLPPVPCLAGEINQVLLNLIVNAAHAIAEVAKQRPGGKGIITVRTRSEPECIRIEVCDNGSGIPKQAQPHVFNLFFTTKEVGKGTGQGLAFAYASVVQKHGGRISFDTEVGAGTTFIVRLPLVGVCAGVA